MSKYVNIEALDYAACTNTHLYIGFMFIYVFNGGLFFHPIRKVLGKSMYELEDLYLNRDIFVYVLKYPKYIFF